MGDDVKKADPGFIYVRLKAATGDLVSDLAIPPFARLPEVINWGSRTFLRDDDCHPVYNEVFAYVAEFDEDEA